MIVVPQDIAQKVFDSLIERQFQDIIPHFTMELVQKLMSMMQSPTMDFDELVEEFHLRDTKVVVKGDTVIYKTPPANLTTRWVFVDDNYKINDFSHKVNWFWVILNFSKVRQFRNKMKQAQIAKEAQAVG
ncbi:MAG: hypothetical protein COB04_19110 [Gammaproteobacteria bacterium]|nr:MAG: hypothetical protein COB04_19110 [Gammaproteobacteria bacterium]